MSRREFRGSLVSARPLSAYGLVAIGTATLAITGQLATWCLVCAVLAIGFAALFRERPLALQQTGLAPNLALAAIMLASGWLLFDGQLVIIALAHFATLAQGLQLMDARPRRSEFLLVALSLFQMILASNLTDSVLFPPLLAAFVMMTVWTLLVHTIRTEAVEAGEPHSAGRVITPGLLRMTLAATALSLVFALVIFLLLPRIRSGSMLTSPLGGPAAMAGFSDRIQLGDIGRIRQDRTLVLRVETERGVPPSRRDAYWRGLAFDHFDGRTWAVSGARRERLVGLSVHGIRIETSDPNRDLVQNVVREPVASGVLFGAGHAEWLQGDIGIIERDRNGALYAGSTIQSRIRYTIETREVPRHDGRLREDRSSLPEPDGDRFLELPPLSDATHELAASITADAGSDADRAVAIERHLLETGRYTDVPPAAPADDEISPIEVFLFGGMAGHCEYFATSFVVLARSVGLPARLVNGFAGGEENPIGGFIELTRSDAHAWAEVHFEAAGWVRYDPTPPDLRLRSAGTSLGHQLGAIASALEHWWFQHVVSFDRSDQASALRRGWLAWKGWRDDRRPDQAAGKEPKGNPLAKLTDLDRRWLALLAVLAVGALAAARRRARHAGVSVPAAYATALRLLKRRGLSRSAATTSRDFVREVVATLPAPTALVFARLTDAYLAERFGSAERGAGRADLSRLRHLLEG